MSNNFFSDSEKAVLLLMKVQRALGSQRASKKYIVQTLSRHGLDHEQALESLERKGYIVSVGYKRSYVALTTKGKTVRL